MINKYRNAFCDCFICKYLLSSHVEKLLNMWVVIIIVCLIAGVVMEPLSKKIRKMVSSKWLSVILQLIVSFFVLMTLYGIASLLGFNIYK